MATYCVNGRAWEMNRVEFRIKGLPGKNRFQHPDLGSRYLYGTGLPRILEDTVTALPVHPGEIFQIEDVGAAGPEESVPLQYLLDRSQILGDNFTCAPGQLNMGIVTIGLTIDDFR